MKSYLLAIDQGTTSTRAVILDKTTSVLGFHQIAFKQYFPQDGWVEHDPEEIWQTVLICCQTALHNAGVTAKDIAAIGISNQRETTIIWDRKTAKPIYPAIVWQDRRTTLHCHHLALKKQTANEITEKTGLLLDPYFSATKISWILDNIEGSRARAKNGELAFGTIDSYLLWRFTNGAVHATDATNASRTLLFNVHTQDWDTELLSLFDIPNTLLPSVLDNNAHFGDTDPALLGAAIPITGIAGDQQAATIGQACFKKGMMKCTYGTGGFILLNTGDEFVRSSHRLLSTIAYRINNQVTYGLEGSIFSAGTAIQWLKNTLGMIKHTSEIQSLTVSVKDNAGVYLIPAFTGMGAPHWDPDARGALLGITRDTRTAHIVRAALEAVCYQTRDLLEAMLADYSGELSVLRVDGGMVKNDWLLQFLSDILDAEVERPKQIEASVLGAAFLAGLGAGLYQNLEEVSQYWENDRSFQPNMQKEMRESLYCGWQKAVARVVKI